MAERSWEEYMRAAQRAREAGDVPAVNAIMQQAQQAHPERAAQAQPGEEYYDRPMTNVGDVARSIGSGLLTGAHYLAGTPGDLSELVGMGVKAAGRKMGFEPGPELPRRPFGLPDISPPTSQRLMATTGHTPYEGKSVASRMAGRAAEFIPQAVTAAPRAMRGAAALAGLSGAASEGAGEIASNVAPEFEPAARIGTALATPFVAGRAARALAPGAQQPSPGRARLTQNLADEGVTSLTPGQRSGSQERLRWEQMQAPGRAGAMRDQAQREFNRAALRPLDVDDIQVDGRRLIDVVDELGVTPEVLQATRNELSRRFEDFARHDLMPDRQMVRDIQGAASRYVSYVEGTPARAVTDVVERLRDYVQRRRPLPGSYFHKLQSEMGKAGRSAQSGPARSAYFGIQRALHDAMERQLLRTGRAADYQAWQETRQQYRHWLVLADTMKKATGARGEVSPRQLRSSAARLSSTDEYLFDNSPYSELSKAGAQILPEPSSSGTAENMAQLLRGRLLSAGGSGIVGALGGTGAGQFLGSPEAIMGLGGAAAGMMIPPAVANWTLRTGAGLRPPASRTPALLTPALTATQGVM